MRCHVCGKKPLSKYGDYWLCDSHYLAILQKLESDPPVLIKRAKKTKTIVSLRKGGESGETTKWATVCEDHGGIVYHYTKAAAISELLHPDQWCPDCQETA